MFCAFLVVIQNRYHLTQETNSEHVYNVNLNVSIITLWTAASQASLSITISQSLLKLMSESSPTLQFKSINSSVLNFL